MKTPARRKKKEEGRKKGRGPLKSMRVSMGFREFVLDQLGGVPGLQAKTMFGGVGLYSGDIFFGIMAADVLYFKVNDASKVEYQAARSQPFAPFVDPTAASMTTAYYSVPAEVLESAPTVLAWAKTSIAVAKAGRKAKASARASR